MVLQVLTEPKNALGKQYKKLFSMNNVRILPMHAVFWTLSLVVFWLLYVNCITSHPISGEATFYREGTETDCQESNGKEYWCQGLKGLTGKYSYRSHV